MNSASASSASGQGTGRPWRGRARARGWDRGRGRGDRTSTSSGGLARGPPGRGSNAPRGADSSRGTGVGRQRQPSGAIFMQGRPPTAVDARINDDSDKAVVANLHSSDASIDTPTGPQGLPLRPDFGTQGREIVLRANYFPVDVQGKIFRYKTEIILSDPRNSNKLSRRVKQRVFRLAEQTVDWQQAGMSGHVAHDSAEKLVASIQLPQPLTIHGAYYDEGQDGPPAEGGTKYTLMITFEEEVDQQLLKECLAGYPVDSQALAKVLSALNLVLTAHPSQTGVKIGRDDDKKKHPDQRLFFGSPEPADIGGGLAVREGFYVSVRPAHQQLMVNVNTCHAAFYKPQNFKDALDEYTQFVRGSVGTFASQVRVTTQPNNHVVTIQGVSKRNALEHCFKHGEFGWVTIAQYYERKHRIKLDRPDLPLLEGPKGSVYPAEVCDILPDQGFKGELTDKKHAKNMLDLACKPPKENASEIVNKGLDMLGFRNSNPVLDSFGVHVGTEMAVVPGRVLDKPGLSYSNNAPADIDERASWNLREVKFAVGARLDNWAVLVIQDGGYDDFKGSGDPVLRQITTGFLTMCNKSGMQMRLLGEGACAAVRLPRGFDRFRDDAIADIERAIKELMKKVAPDLILVMLSNDDKAIYNGLKRLCDVELDIATVCMQSSKVKNPKSQRQYYANVALKVNMKMGGINHMLDADSGTWLKSEPTMIMGMDVTHPAKGVSVDGAPSIVAVVASIDDRFAQYPAALTIRRSKVEIDRDPEDGDNVLMDMFISRFELYKARNGDLPKRVILYRDGVSESQFVQVRQYELTKMRKAFASFSSPSAPYEPKLSIVICGKRHNTRFYPARQGDAARDGNPLPGTVVDRGVTLAYEFDFFLQAHGGLKGTTRPTHYFVVHDENGFKADELQRVTNDLSYMFARATKAVSLVSAAYWADVACERGRCYLHKLLMGAKEGGAEAKAKDKDKGKGKKRAEETVFEKAGVVWAGGVSGPRLKDTMFYL